jgi:hypothetical protein
LANNEYYDFSRLGEKDAGEYSGPLDPGHEYDSLRGEIVFEDQKFLDEFFHENLEGDIFKLKKSWFEELPAMSSCPNFYLNENLAYVQYLFRLLTISYLVESLKVYSVTSHQLKLPSSVCNLQWQEIFSKCRPESSDMRKFLRRAKHRYLTGFDLREFPQMGKGEVKNWILSLQKGGKIVDPVIQKDYEKYCDSVDCKKISSQSIKSFLSKSCQEDRQMIETLCSEKDILYGASYLKLPIELLLNSHALNVINEGGHGRKCLERFVVLSKNKEHYYERLVNLYPLIYEKLKSVNAQYIQGDLFLPGALKEFDKKGLTNFLFTPPEKVSVEKVARPKPVETPFPVAIVKKIEKPTLFIQRPRPAPTPVPKVKKKIKISYFEKMNKKLQKEKLKRLKIEMPLFKKDFTYNKNLLKLFNGPLKDYQTRVALEDMKKFDRLGSTDEPMRLIFLKYYIDYNKHQGLWNIITVLGNRFYVKNDIDKTEKPILIEIKNDSTTNNSWQLSILKNEKAP